MGWFRLLIVVVWTTFSAETSSATRDKPYPQFSPKSERQDQFIAVDSHDPAIPARTPQEAGAELKAVLNLEFNNVAAKSSKDDVDATAVIKQYIPVGTSFRVAEEILRAAGFGIDKRPVQYFRGGPTIEAEIDNYRSGFFWIANLYVLLTPKTPGQYDFVSSIQGDFSFSSI